MADTIIEYIYYHHVIRRAYVMSNALRFAFIIYSAVQKMNFREWVKEQSSHFDSQIINYIVLDFLEHSLHSIK